MTDVSDEILCRSCNEPMNRPTDKIYAWYCSDCDVKATLDWEDEIPKARLHVLENKESVRGFVRGRVEELREEKEKLEDKYIPDEALQIAGRWMPEDDYTRWLEIKCFLGELRRLQHEMGWDESG